MSKLQFDREQLLSRLKLNASIIPKKAIIAAHEQFLFKVQGGVAAITSSDGQKQITTSCPTTKCEGDTMFTIPGKLLFMTLGLLLDNEVKFTLKSNQVTLKCGKSTYKMNSEDGTSYPFIPEIKSSFEASFSGALFNEALETVKKYTDPENSVVAQQGVNLSFKDNKINAYGFRGFEICKVVITPRSVNSWKDILIPTSAVKAITSCVNDSDIVDVSHDEQKIEIRTNDVSIIALGLDVKYPDVEKFYRSRPQTAIKHNTVQFLKALERLKPYASDVEPRIIMDIKTAQTMLSVINKDYGHDGEEEIDAMASHTCMIGMNVHFMIRAIESFTNDEFYIFYDKPNSPVFIEPHNIVKDNDKFILLAPMTLEN